MTKALQTTPGPKVTRPAAPGKKRGTLPRYGSRVINLNSISTRTLIGGGYIFGCDSLRILGKARGPKGDAGYDFMRECDAVLARNEAAVGWHAQQEQLAWVFCQLVRTADALGVPVNDQRATDALMRRLGKAPLGEAMIMCVWAFTLLPDDALPVRPGRFKDTLEDSVTRARAWLKWRGDSDKVGGRFIDQHKSPAKLRADAWVREQCAPSRKAVKAHAERIAA